MKKVAIITLYGNHNMGNRLQAYAVMRLYRSLGCDVTFVNHKEPELIPGAGAIDGIKAGVKDTLARLLPNLHPKLRRRRLFLGFSDRYLTPSEAVSMKRVPPDLKERYDFFSVGSDLVWRNCSGSAEESRFFFLQFADRWQRLCLSPSFGLEEIPESEAAVYREGLNGFPRLSCREASSVELIRTLTGRDAALLPDPTMCLSVEEWERLERKPSYPLPERYLCSYMLGQLSPEKKMAISRYARLLGAELVNLNDFGNFTDCYAATGPQEFLYLIRHAHFVCTNSFHGTVFSLLFRRNFICFNRDDSSVTGDMSGRITTLLDKFHLSSRRYGVLADGDLLSTDYTGAEETLSRERKRMLDYLKESLGESV